MNRRLRDIMDRTPPPLAAEIDRLRAEVTALKAALGEAETGLEAIRAMGPKVLHGELDIVDIVDTAMTFLARSRAHLEKSAEPPRENAALLGEANQAINTMLELWEAHTSSQPASRADEIERALNRVRRAAARVSRALIDKPLAPPADD